MSGEFTGHGTQSASAAAKVAYDEAQARYDELRAANPEKYRRRVPARFVPNYLAAVDGTASARQAIKAFCAECCGYDREAVATCPAQACPLWRYRPWRPR